MKITSISNEEISVFCHVKGAESIGEQTIQNLITKGMTKPEWCFLVKEEKNIIGRVGFMKGGSDIQLIMFGLYFPQSDDAARFPVEVFNLLKEKQIRNISYHLDSDTENYPEKLNLLKKAGMQVIQTKKNYILKEEDYQKRETNRLIYKPLSEVGKEAYLEALKRVAEETLDREDARSYEKSGLQKGVEEHYDLLQDLGDPKDTWYLAYTHEELAGLIIPQKFNDKVGAINYIGVVPKQRGRHYVLDLLDKGVTNLFNRGITRIIADIDDLNMPMENALEEIGFKEENKIWVLNTEL